MLKTDLLALEVIYDMYANRDFLLMSWKFELANFRLTKTRFGIAKNLCVGTSYNNGTRHLVRFDGRNSTWVCLVSASVI